MIVHRCAIAVVQAKRGCLISRLLVCFRIWGTGSSRMRNSEVTSYSPQASNFCHSLQGLISGDPVTLTIEFLSVITQRGFWWSPKILRLSANREFHTTDHMMPDPLLGQELEACSSCQDRNSDDFDAEFVLCSWPINTIQSGVQAGEEFFSCLQTIAKQMINDGENWL